MTTETTPSAPAAAPSPKPWSLMKKRKSGVKLTVEEKKILSEYNKKYARQRSPQYLTKVEKETWEALAEKKNMALNPWMRQQVHASLMDKSPAEQRLEEEIKRLTAERDNLTSQVGRLATDNAENRRKAENLVDDLRLLAHRLAEARQERLEAA